MSVTDRAVGVLWVTPPRLAARWGFPTVARVLADGGWLRAWPPAAILAPAVGIGVGWYAATSRSIDEQVFTASMGLMVLFALVAAFGALLGLLALATYSIGDLLTFHHSFDAAILHPDGVGHVAYVVAPLVTTYVLLALLTVNVPLGATSVRDAVRARAGEPAGVLAGAAATLGATWSWVAVAPVVLRSTYAYQSVWDTPVHGPTLIFTPILEHGWTVVIVATAAMSVRLTLESVVHRPPVAPVGSSTAREHSWRAPLSVLGGGGFAFALVGAVSQTKGQFMLLVAACFGAALLRWVLLPALTPYRRLIERAPVVARAGGAVAVTYGIAAVLSRGAASPATNPSNSNASIVLGLAIAAPLVALLLPAPSRRGVAS